MCKKKHVYSSVHFIKDSDVEPVQLVVLITVVKLDVRAHLNFVDGENYPLEPISLLGTLSLPFGMHPHANFQLSVNFVCLCLVNLGRLCRRTHTQKLDHTKNTKIRPH